jgi:hypothetical protein
MARPKKECPKCGLLNALELERFDLSYKNRAGSGDKVEPVAVLPKPRKSSDDRDKLMFNAGRYAAGATDKVAVDAHNLLQIVLGDA